MWNDTEDIKGIEQEDWGYGDCDGYDDDEWDRGCVLGAECLHHDPEHTSDECFNLEMAQEYDRDGMRTTDEYSLGKTEERARIVTKIDELITEIAGSHHMTTYNRPTQKYVVRILEELKTWIEEQHEQRSC